MSKSKKKKKSSPAKAQEREELRRMRTEMQMKQNRRALLAIAGIVLCIVIAVACVIAATNASPTVYTAEQYAQLENGMSYEEVTKLLGSKGDAVKEASSEEVQTYIWTNDDGSHITVTFVDDAATGFNQKGLDG